MVKMNPVKNAKDDRGKNENKCKDRCVAGGNYQLFSFKNNGSQKENQGADGKADRHMGYRGVQGLVIAKLCQEFIKCIKH
jgi:hypothetical protein